MIPLRLSQIAGITGGALYGPDRLVDGPVVTDSRQMSAGGLYVARVGEHADGHRYAPEAARAGAVGTLGSRPIDGVPTIVVDDVQAAFAALARGVIDRAEHLAVVGITGSSGKTSTKDMLGHVLESADETVFPVGSLNSEVGVPLTVCRVTPTTRYLVAEMGADGVGHIAYLTRIAPPQVGIVLNVGTAHVGNFGSVEAIADTKAALVEALPADGLAVLNADDHRVAAMARRTRARVVTVGRGEDAQVRARDIELDEQGRARFVVHGPDGSTPVRLAVHGEHQVGNALAVIVAARHLGLPMDQIVGSLATARAMSRWRMEVHELPTGVTVINDAYNANPDSMSAGLHALAQMGAGRRTVAVLGQMRELGEFSEAGHEQVGQVAARLGVTTLLVVGAEAQGIARGAADGHTHVVTVPDVDAAHAWLTDHLTSGDTVLFKSSRDSGLRYLGDRIVTDAGGRVRS